MQALQFRAKNEGSKPREFSSQFNPKFVDGAILKNGFFMEQKRLKCYFLLYKNTMWIDNTIMKKKHQ